MTRDEIIELAQKIVPGLQHCVYHNYISFTVAELEDFATFVAAAEREACAKLCLRPHGWLSHGQQVVANEIRVAILARQRRIKADAELRPTPKEET